jgi:uncharacterized protein YcbK (DUF882 family)
MNLNFKISELIHSDLAVQNNINNMPDINALDNLLELTFYCLQPIRDLIKKPMIITSGFRCSKVNFFAGGAINSQHLYGQAADFIIKGMAPKEIIEVIKNSNIEYDQLINEFDKWVHVSFNKGKNRKQILKY